MNIISGANNENSDYTDLSRLVLFNIMKMVKRTRLIAIFIFLFIFISTSSTKSIKVKTFTNALRDVINNLFIQKLIRFDMLVVESGKTVIMSEILENILKFGKFEPLQISFMKLSIIETRQLYLKTPVVIFLNSQKDLDRIEGKTRIESVDYPDNFLILYVMLQRSNSKEDDFIENEQDIEPFLPNFSHNHPVNFQVFLTQKSSQSKNLIISTIERFIQPSCNHRLQIVNEFSYSEQKWLNGNFGLKDEDNFNGCKLRIDVV